MSTVEITLWAVGIAVTLIVGVVGVRSITKKRLSQNQKVGKDSVAIQSGRDTNIKDGE